MKCSLSLNIKKVIFLSIAVIAVAVIPEKAGTQNQCVALAPGVRRGNVKNITRWSLERGEYYSPIDASLQLVILDPDHHAALSSYPIGTLKVATVSIGEAEDRRPYWKLLSSASYLVEQDKEAEGATRVDFRDPDWQSLLTQVEIPRILSGGFQGLLLDNLDSVSTLEDRDPAKFAGSREALERWIAALRKSYPHLLLLAMGSDTLELATPSVDGIVVDGVFTTWHSSLRHSRRTTQEERDERLDQIANALVRSPLPVFTLEYADPEDPSQAIWAVKQSRAHRFRPFIK